MTGLLTREIVAVGETGDEYTFAIPGLDGEVRIGLRMQSIRRRIEPDWNGIERLLDFETTSYLRAAATLEVCLKTATTKWPFSTSANGQPVVDSAKWPDDKFTEVVAVFDDYYGKVTRFRAAGSADPKPDGAETVANGENSGSAAVPG